MTPSVSLVNRRYRPHGEGSTTGAEEHALALEFNWCRIAYGARRSANLDEAMRRAENPMETIVSILCTEGAMWLSSRTSQIDAPSTTLTKYPAKIKTQPSLSLTVNECAL